MNPALLIVLANAIEPRGNWKHRVQRRAPPAGYRSIRDGNTGTYIEAVIIRTLAEGHSLPTKSYPTPKDHPQYKP